MAKREKPTKPYSSDQLDMLLGKTMDKLVDEAESRERNIALPGAGEVYQYQLRELVHGYVGANDIRTERDYADRIKAKIALCNLEDCTKALFVKMNDLKAIGYFLGRVDEEFRVGEVIEGSLDANSQKELKEKIERYDNAVNNIYRQAPKDKGLMGLFRKTDNDDGEEGK